MSTGTLLAIVVPAVGVCKRAAVVAGLSSIIAQADDIPKSWRS